MSARRRSRNGLAAEQGSLGLELEVILELWGRAQMKRLRWMIAGSIALLLLGGARSAADTQLVLKGRVTDENGLRVGGAQVKLEVAGGQSSSAQTDDAGYFSFLNLSPGEYNVRIEKQ